MQEKRCLLNPFLTCNAEKTSDCICLECVTGDNVKNIERLANVLRRLKCNFEDALEVAGIILKLSSNMADMSKWFKLYRPDYFAEFQKRQETKLKELKDSVLRYRV